MLPSKVSKRKGRQIPTENGMLDAMANARIFQIVRENGQLVIQNEKYKVILTPQQLQKLARQMMNLRI